MNEWKNTIFLGYSNMTVWSWECHFSVYIHRLHACMSDLYWCLDLSSMCAHYICWVLCTAVPFSLPAGNQGYFTWGQLHSHTSPSGPGKFTAIFRDAPQSLIGRQISRLKRQNTAHLPWYIWFIAWGFVYRLKFSGKMKFNRYYSKENLCILGIQ